MTSDLSVLKQTDRQRLITIGHDGRLAVAQSCASLSASCGPLPGERDQTQVVAALRRFSAIQFSPDRIRSEPSRSVPIRISGRLSSQSVQAAERYFCLFDYAIVFF